MKQQSDQMQEDNKYKWNNKNETEVWKDEKKNEYRNYQTDMNYYGQLNIMRKW